MQQQQEQEPEPLAAVERSPSRSFEQSPSRLEPIPEGPEDIWSLEESEEAELPSPPPPLPIAQPEEDLDPRSSNRPEGSLLSRHRPSGLAGLAPQPESEHIVLSSPANAQYWNSHSEATSSHLRPDVPRALEKEALAGTEAAPKEWLAGLHSNDARKASRAWARVGQFQQRQKNFHQARLAYQQALELDGSQPGTLANLSQIEAQAGNVPAALELIEKAVALEPQTASYQAFRNRLRQAGQRRPEALSRTA